MPSKSRAAKKDKLFRLIEWIAARPLLTELTLTTITVLFGMQVLRVLIPDFNWILGNRIGFHRSKWAWSESQSFSSAFSAAR